MKKVKLIVLKGALDSFVFSTKVGVRNWSVGALPAVLCVLTYTMVGMRPMSLGRAPGEPRARPIFANLEKNARKLAENVAKMSANAISVSIFRRLRFFH